MWSAYGVCVRYAEKMQLKGFIFVIVIYIGSIITIPFNTFD